MYKARKSYTIIEILIVLTIIIVLSGTVQVPNSLRLRMIAEETVCEENRRLIRDATINYASSNNVEPVSFLDLVDQRFIASVPECSSEGIYSWGIDGKGSLDKNKVVCSIHGVYPEDVE